MTPYKLRTKLILFTIFLVFALVSGSFLLINQVVKRQVQRPFGSRSGAIPARLRAEPERLTEANGGIFHHRSRKLDFKSCYRNLSN